METTTGEDNDDYPMEATTEEDSDDLLDAFRANDRSLVLNILYKSDIDFREPIDDHGTTFLHKAAECIHGRMCAMVIDYSSSPIDVNSKNSVGFTPLHVAALSNRESCSVLLKYGAEVNSTTNAEFTPLQKAAMHGSYKACRLLCRTEQFNVKGRSVFDVNKELDVNWQSFDEETALHQAIDARNQAIMKSKKIWPFKRQRDRYTKIVKLLLRMGAQVNLQSCVGETPLHIAARHEMDYIVKLLLHYNADVHITNKNGKTALDLTKDNLYSHVKNFLKENEFNSKLLFEGVQQNDVAKVDRVLQYDNLKYKNFNVNGSIYDSLLHVAARNRNYQICKMLIEFEADVNMLNVVGQSSLQIAEGNLNFDICRLLVRKRKEKKIRYNKALHISVRENDISTCKIHINSVDVNEIDEKMRTPLHVAMIFASDEICDLLLKYGADVFAKDIYNDTPIQLAFYHERLDLRKKLLTYLPYFG